jgi:hypothetical protein
MKDLLKRFESTPWKFLLCAIVFTYSLYHFSRALDHSHEMASDLVRPKSVSEFKNLGRPENEDVFLLEHQETFFREYHAKTTFVIAQNPKKQGTALRTQKLPVCLSLESAIFNKINVQIETFSNLAASLKVDDSPVIVSLDEKKTFLWLTRMATDSFFEEKLKKSPLLVPKGSVLIPGSRACTEGEGLCGEDSQAKSSFKFGMKDVMFGRSQDVKKLLQKLGGECAGKSVECVKKGVESGQIKIDSGCEVFQDTTEIPNMDHLNPLKFNEEKSKDHWEAGSHGGSVKNPETATFPRILVFRKQLENFQHSAGKWRIQEFMFQPQGVVHLPDGKKQSFLQETCPHKIMPWLPLEFPSNAPNRSDARCSSACIEGSGICGPDHGFPRADGSHSECDGDFTCCSPGGWCGYTPDHCDCPTCIDYSKISAIRSYNRLN